MRDDADALARLEADGFLAQVEGRRTPTRRWRGAMMRASAACVATPDAPEDLRVPVAMALIARYGSDIDDEQLVRLVLAMAEIEAAENASAP